MPWSIFRCMQLVVTSYASIECVTSNDPSASAPGKHELHRQSIAAGCNRARRVHVNGCLLYRFHQRWAQVK